MSMRPPKANCDSSSINLALPLSEDSVSLDIYVNLTGLVRHA